MSIWQRPTDSGAWLVGVEGRLAQDLNPQLEAALLGLLADDHCRLIVDLTGTSYINSGGLRTLVTAWRRARQQGGDLVLFGLSRHVQEVFEIVGFDRVFQIFPSLDEAASALSADA